MDRRGDRKRDHLERLRALVGPLLSLGAVAARLALYPPGTRPRPERRVGLPVAVISAAFALPIAAEPGRPPARSAESGNLR